MAEYYGVTRTPEYLMHYGVKGMRWGVRRAKEKANAKRLERHYEKAKRHLRKLKDRTDINKQKAEYKDRMSIAGASSLAGAGLIGGSLGLRALARKNNSRAIMAGNIGLLPFVYDTETGPKFAVPAGAALSAYGMYNTGKAVAAINRTTPKGHKKAVNKYNNFKKEMSKAFAGTQYASKPRHKTKRK